jgi:processive 1,2-diacylglycerol beta-glucosyltransferase
MVDAKKRVLVITDHMPWGHRSIAKAIYSYLKSKEGESDYKVDYAEVKARTGVGGDIYTFIYRFFPMTNRLAYKMSKPKMAGKILSEMSAINLPELRKTVNKFKPDLIICTYFYHSHALANWRTKEGKKFKLWTVVADPWTIVPVSYIKDVDLHLVYDERGVKEAKAMGIPKEKVLATGWWVRPEMYQKIDRERARKKLGISDDRPLVFVGGGSLGTSSLSKILPFLMLIKTKVGFVFNTGVDKLAFNMVEEYARLLKTVRRDNLIQIKNMGWIENMAEVLAACDIVFGKAGPNFMFDSIAREKPFVAITHIGGQEDGNIDLIVEKRLGWVREKGNNAGRFLLKYLEDPKKYQDKCKVAVHEEAMRNRESMEKIRKKISYQKWELQ